MARAALVSPADTTTRHNQSWVPCLGCHGLSWVPWVVLGATDGPGCHGLSWVPHTILGAMDDLECHGLSAMNCFGCHRWSCVLWMLFDAMESPGCHRWFWVPQMVLGTTDGPECHGQSWVPRMLLGAMDDPECHGLPWVLRSLSLPPTPSSVSLCPHPELSIVQCPTLLQSCQRHHSHQRCSAPLLATLIPSAWQSGTKPELGS